MQILNRFTSKAYIHAMQPRFRVALLLLPLVVPALAAQSSTSKTSSAPGQSADNNGEIVTHDETTTFKVNVNLVLVRVVVRDSKGKVIGNLHKEDFQLFDNRKPQVISQFSVEQPGATVAAMHESEPGTPTEKSSQPAAPPAIPERYVAYVFDDVHMEFGDLAQVRKAAERHIATLHPTDRAAIFSTSGKTMLDFTDDRARLHDALSRGLWATRRNAVAHELVRVIGEARS